MANSKFSALQLMYTFQRKRYISIVRTEIFIKVPFRGNDPSHVYGSQEVVILICNSKLSYLCCSS